MRSAFSRSWHLKMATELLHLRCPTVHVSRPPDSSSTRSRRLVRLVPNADTKRKAVPTEVECGVAGLSSSGPADLLLELRQECLAVLFFEAMQYA